MWHSSRDSCHEIYCHTSKNLEILSHCKDLSGKSRKLYILVLFLKAQLWQCHINDTCVTAAMYNNKTYSKINESLKNEFLEKWSFAGGRIYKRFRFEFFLFKVIQTKNVVLALKNCSQTYGLPRSRWTITVWFYDIQRVWVRVS